MTSLITNEISLNIIPDATNTTGPDGQYWNPVPPPNQQQPIQQQPLHQGSHARKYSLIC